MTILLDSVGSIENKAWVFSDLLTLDDKGHSLTVSSEEILELLKLCRLGRIPIRLRDKAGNETSASIDIEQKDLSEVIRLLISPTANNEWHENAQVTASFELFREFYGFETVVQSSSEGVVVVKTPAPICRVHRRELDRCALSEERQFEVRIREASGRRHFSGLVTNLSSKGLGIVVSTNAEKNWQRILHCEKDLILEARIPALRESEEVSARVVRWTRQGETVYFGVSCPTSLATGDERTLEDFILEQKYPNVRRARTDADYGDVWRLLNQAFKTIDAAPDAGRQDESTITWKKAAWSREGINRIYVLERETDDKQATERLGTIAVSRFYSRTWLIHQLGVDGTKGQALSHQLYGRVLDYLRDTQAARYTLGTFPKDSHVFQQYYLAFIRSDPHPEYHYLEDTNIVEFNVDKARRDLERVIRSIPVTVTPMDAVGAVVVMRALRTQYPKVFLEALDIREYDMALHEVEAIYQAVALTRARKWFVAKTGGAIVGAAYAEWGSESQNVFSLFDNFRLFSFCEDDAVSRAAKCQLLKAVFNTYVENSVKLAITWSRDPEIVEYCPSGKVFFEAYLWLANAVRMKAFLRHLDRLHGRVGIMRSMRRKTPSET